VGELFLPSGEVHFPFMLYRFSSHPLFPHRCSIIEIIYKPSLHALSLRIKISLDPLFPLFNFNINGFPTCASDYLFPPGSGYAPPVTQIQYPSPRTHKSVVLSPDVLFTLQCGPPSPILLLCRRQLLKTKATFSLFSPYDPL